MSPAPGETTAPAEVKIKIEHMTAATLGRDRDSRLVGVKKLQDVWKKRGDEELFKQEAEENIDEKQPNFRETKQVLTSLVNSPDLNVQRRGQELTTKINLLQEVAEKRNPGDVEPNALADAHIQLVGRAVAEIPAMVSAIATESGLSIASVKRNLEQGTVPPNSKAARMLESIIKNDRFLSILNKDIGSIEYTEELVGLEADISSRDQQIISKQRSINGDRSIYTNQQGTGGYDIIARLQNNLNNIQGYTSLQRSAAEYTRLQGSFNNNTLQQNQLGRTQLTSADVPQYQNDIDTILQQKGALGTQPNLTRQNLIQNPQLLQNVRVMVQRNNNQVEDPQQTASLRSEILTLVGAYDNASRISALYVANPNFDQDYSNYNLFVEYNKAGGERDKIDKRQADLDQETGELRKLLIRRDKHLNAFAQKVNRVLNKSTKDFYNKSILSQAQAVADHEANQKIDDEKEIKDMKEKREKILEQVMDKYLMRTYFKFSGNDVIGREDDDLKNFVKHDILSTTPGKLSKDLLKRIYSKRSSMPPEHKKEIDQLFKDMGLTAGPHAVTANQIIESMDLEHTENWAAKHVPNVMGYAETGGYYFDRLKLKQPQMEYLKNVYGAEFFGKVVASKKEFADDIAKMYNGGGEYNDFMDNGVLSKKKIKEFLVGKDWTGGVKRLWKLAGILGTAWFLGGGLSSAAVPNSAAFWTQGWNASVDTVKNVGAAGVAVARAGSRTTRAVTNAVAGSFNATTGIGTGIQAVNKILPNSTF